MIIYQFHGCEQKDIEDVRFMLEKDSNIMVDETYTIKIDSDTPIPIIHITKVPKK